MPAESDFYSGLPGIAFFLAYLGALTEHARATDLARSVAQMLRRRLEGLRGSSAGGIGAFAGWGAQIYLFSHLYALWREPWLLDAARQCVEQIAPLIEQDTYFDIIAGAAGCIAVLLSLYSVAPSYSLMKYAMRCGKRLIAGLELTAVADPVVALQQKGVLTGYAHGAAGMALSLLQLAAISGESSFQEAALILLAFERSLFSVQHQNWPDLREIRDGKSGDGERFMTAWCHGAPGIGLSRLAMLDYLDQSMIRQEVEVALHTTLRAGFGNNHSLCHGDLGNLELLLSASLHPAMKGDETLLPLVCWKEDFPLVGPLWQDSSFLNSALAYHTGRVLANGESSGWITGIPLGVETPGMMAGLAGIGYQLLRLSAPLLVPNVLLLSTPAGANGDGRIKRCQWGSSQAS